MPLRITDQNFSRTTEVYRQTVRYYAGSLCSCIAENNGVPALDCDCILGYRYPETPEIITAIRQNVDLKILKLPSGRIYDGGASFTIPKSFNGREQNAWRTLAHGDIIALENKQRRDTDILRKGSRDKLLAFDVKEILSVSSRSVKFIEGADYTVQGTNIIWDPDSENQPSEGDYYAVEFICNQQYKVWEMGGKERGTDGDELPKRVNCILRRYIETAESNPLDKVDYLSDEI